jgi:hypothetical protein
MGIGATGPILGGQSSPVEAGIQQAVTQTGGVVWRIAKDFNLELSPHPAGATKRLWFDVGDKVWPGITDPDDTTIRTVVDAFNADRLEIMVYYSGQMIFQLVVRRKG